MESINYEESVEWSVFVAALTSYKFGSLIESELIKYKDKKELENLSNRISEKLLLEKYDNKEYEYLQKFKVTKNFSLKLCNTDKKLELLNKFSHENIKIDIDPLKIFIFEVNKDQHNDEFEKLRNNFGSIQGLHGSSVSHFYSILQNGLEHKENVDSPGLFGDGIYLSTKIDVALTFARSHTYSYGLFRNKSLQIVALCDVITDPVSTVIYNKDDTKEKIPREYLLVKDKSMIKITHLIVLLSCKISELKIAKELQELHINNQLSTNCFTRFLQRLFHKMRQNGIVTVVFIYIFVLFFIHAFSGRSVLDLNWDSTGLIEDD